ncbi:MAG: DUF512 domain-containing protein, partial [Dehalobacterium sp.]
YDHYEGFPQIENGVGLVRYFWSEFKKASVQLPKALKSHREIIFVTGMSGGAVLHPIRERLNMIENLKVDIRQIPNEFFGNTVTVAGLLTGHDLVSGLKDWRQGQIQRPEIFITSTMLKYEEDIFLDNMTVTQVENILDCKINVLEPNGKSIVDAVSR